MEHTKRAAVSLIGLGAMPTFAATDVRGRFFHFNVVARALAIRTEAQPVKHEFNRRNAD